MTKLISILGMQHDGDPLQVVLLKETKNGKKRAVTDVK